MRLLGFSACSLFIISVLCPGNACIAGKDADPLPGSAPAAARFDHLKALVGEWQGTAKHGTTEFETTVSYKLTSGGKTLMETQFPGTDHEMITMYHLDGDNLMLTHYCAAGNQPRMKAEPGTIQVIVFKFMDGTNLDLAKDMHMHDATLVLVDDDHIRSEWVSFAKGKAIGSAKFDMKRKPKLKS
ncbi:MAG: hypothetical protein EXS05_09050 [Planctomycetaceae bacterium]|nr:hypothetical protein [Planctomycetaceae bacterium]